MVGPIASVNNSWTRTLGGMAVRMPGVFARRSDIPSEYKELKNKTTQNEVVKVGMQGAFSVLNEVGMAVLKQTRLGGKLKLDGPLMQFVPQVAGAAFAEISARVLTRYNFNEALKKAHTNPAGDSFESSRHRIDTAHAPAPKPTGALRKLFATFQRATAPSFSANPSGVYYYQQPKPAPTQPVAPTGFH